MPVTLKIQDKDKNSKKPDAGAPPPVDLSDFVAGGTKSGGLIALFLWLFSIIVPCAILYFINDATQPFGLGLFIWWIVATLGYFVAAPWFVMRRLRMSPPENHVTAKNNPSINKAFVQCSKIIGLGEPEVYLLDEGISQIRCMGGKNRLMVVMTKATVKLMQPPELVAQVMRNLIHARQGHTRRLMLLQFLNDTPPPLRLLAWPLVAYAGLLRHFWLESAEQTADRLTLLMVKNYKILVSAILKQQVATDPIMHEQNITPADVDNYMAQDNVIGLQGKEISTQYKMGTAIQDNSALDERIREITSWAKSDEFAEALQKLATANHRAVAPK